MMILKAVLVCKDSERNYYEEQNNEILRCMEISLFQTLTTNDRTSESHRLLLLGAGRLPQNAVEYFRVHYDVNLLKSSRIMVNEEMTSQNCILLEFRTEEELLKLYGDIHDQWFLFSEDIRNDNNEFDAPVFAIKIEDVSVLYNDYGHQKLDNIVSKYNSYRQKIPSCNICLRRLRRFQGYTSFCIARSFSMHDTPLVTNQSGCSVCHTFAMVQDENSHSATDKLHCAACHLQQNLWVCLTCGYIGCGRYSQQHAQLHAHNAEQQASSSISASSADMSSDTPTLVSISLESHSWALELATGRIWDYSLDDYAHYENDHQLILQPKKDIDSSPPHQLRTTSFSEARNLLLENKNKSSKILLVSKEGLSLFGDTSPPGYSMSATSASSSNGHHTNSVTSMKLERIATEYERLMEQQLQEQQMHYDKLIARETVRALQAQCVASAHHPQNLITKTQDSKHHKQASEVQEDADMMDPEAVDAVLKEIERLKIDVSAAEAEQFELLSQFKAQDDATKNAKKRCDQLLRRQRQLQHLEESFMQREQTDAAQLDAEIEELKQQFRDLMFYLETQSNKEINGASIIGSESLTSPSIVPNKSKNGKKK